MIKSIFLKFKIFLVNIFIFLILIIFLELAFGKWFSGIPFIPGHLGSSFIIDRSSAGFDPPVVEVKPNYFGFRIWEKNQMGTQALENLKSCSIIALGGSTTEDRILSINETWTSKVEQILEDYNLIDENCQKIQIINAGVSGHTIATSKNLIDNWILRSKIKPKAFVVYHGINDFKTKNLWAKGSLFDELRVKIGGEVLVKSFILHGAFQIIDAINAYGKASIKADGKTISYLPKHTKNNNSFFYTTLDTLNISNAFGLDQIILHRKQINNFINKINKYFPNTPIVFITQTTPYCDLRSFPKKIGFRPKNREISIHYEKIFSPLEEGWEEIEQNLRDCLRLGFIKTNYIDVAQNHPSAKNIYVIDYAGNFIENNTEAYDEYHKTPDGNEILAKRITPQLLKAFNSFGILNNESQ